jgi:isopropylmalate/homocitrate/citramalate synthase
MATLGNTEDSITALNKYKYPRIHIFIATSDDHIKAKFCKD